MQFICTIIVSWSYELFTSIVIALLVPFIGSSQTEAQYADYIQGLIGGQREVSVPSGRVDLITKKYAFEIERTALRVAN